MLLTTVSFDLSTYANKINANNKNGNQNSKSEIHETFSPNEFN